MFNDILKKGSKGDEVRSLQRRLNAWDNYNLVADGAFGPATEKALKDFQSRQGLLADGVSGKMTTEILLRHTIQAFTGFTGAELTKILCMQPLLADQWVEALNDAMIKGGITTKIRAAAFIANVGHECANFTRLTENLNYSAEGLAKTWPPRYAAAPGKPNAVALRIARNPQAIANNVYADRMGNGNEASGDGWNYRGRSPIMLTGKDNYQLCDKELGLGLVANPDRCLEPEIGAKVSVWFWAKNGINAYADKGDFDGVCDKINKGRKTEKIGDAIGYAERKVAYTKAKEVLGI